MGRLRVAIVIPALNEAASIEKVVIAASHYGMVIVVNDGSNDATANIALQAGAVVESHDVNLGYDAALNSGFQKAAEIGCDVIITVDADGQHDPSLIQRFVDKIESGADVATGIRNKHQRFAEYVFAWYTKFRFGLHDPLCGMKAYKLSVYQVCGHFDSFGSIGTELLLFSVQNGYKVAEVPFEVRDRIGESRFGRVLLANYKIFRAMLISIWRVR